jgi:hypothetical protein
VPALALSEPIHARRIPRRQSRSPSLSPCPLPSTIGAAANTHRDVNQALDPSALQSAWSTATSITGRTKLGGASIAGGGTRCAPLKQDDDLNHANRSCHWTPRPLHQVRPAIHRRVNLLVARACVRFLGAAALALASPQPTSSQHSQPTASQLRPAKTLKPWPGSHGRPKH